MCEISDHAGHSAVVCRHEAADSRGDRADADLPGVRPGHLHGAGPQRASQRPSQENRGDGRLLHTLPAPTSSLDSHPQNGHELELQTPKFQAGH